jgi:hypothetical protein
MGWDKLEYDGEMNKHRHIVCVFSHSSYYDFFIMVLYKFAYPDKLRNLKTLIIPDLFYYFGPLLRYVGGIPATNTNYKNGGATDRIVGILKEQPCKFLISPKGTILRGEWRTGYYHIAQALQAPIIAVGLDYERKGIYIGNLIDSKQEEPIIKKLLYDDLSNIVPLHEEQENMPIREHDKANVSVITYNRIFTLSIITIGSIFGIKYYFS